MVELCPVGVGGWHENGANSRSSDTYARNGASGVGTVSGARGIVELCPDRVRGWQEDGAQPERGNDVEWDWP